MFCIIEGPVALLGKPKKRSHSCPVICEKKESVWENKCIGANTNGQRRLCKVGPISLYPMRGKVSTPTTKLITRPANRCCSRYQVRATPALHENTSSNAMCCFPDFPSYNWSCMYWFVYCTSIRPVAYCFLLLLYLFHCWMGSN